MRTAAVPELTPSFADIQRDSGLDELRVETIYLAVIGTFGLAFGALGVAALGLNRVEADLFGVLTGLTIIAGCAALVIRFSPQTAAVGLICGLTGILSVAVLVWQSPALAPWFSLVVLLASALLNWRWGAVVSLIITAVLIAATHLPAPGMMSSDVALNACLLCWASLFTTWLLSRPTRVALTWAWSSYGQAIDQMKRARERQAELARLSKGLSESYYRMEQLNLELERA